MVLWWRRICDGGAACHRSQGRIQDLSYIEPKSRNSAPPGGDTPGCICMFCRYFFSRSAAHYTFITPYISITLTSIVAPDFDIFSVSVIFRQKDGSLCSRHLSPSFPPEFPLLFLILLLLGSHLKPEFKVNSVYFNPSYSPRGKKRKKKSEKRVIARTQKSEIGQKDQWRREWDGGGSKERERLKARYGVRTGTDRGGEESVSLITQCDTLNYRGASQCNIHFYQQSISRARHKQQHLTGRPVPEWLTCVPTQCLRHHLARAPGCFSTSLCERSTRHNKPKIITLTYCGENFAF